MAPQTNDAKCCLAILPLVEYTSKKEAQTASLGFVLPKQDFPMDNLSEKAANLIYGILLLG